MITAADLREKFFTFLFGEQEGYICLASSRIPNSRGTFKQVFFKWPGEAKQAIDFVEQNTNSHNLWFCVNVLSKPERKKEYCLPTSLIWADLDSCDPDKIEPPPQVVLQTSPARFQAIWRLDITLDPYEAEEYCKRIAYAYREDGADPSGWDLTQLLRIPYTHNFKYTDVDGLHPKVELVRSADPLLDPKLLEVLPLASDLPPNEDAELIEGMPDPKDLPDVQTIMYKYSEHLRKAGFIDVYGYEPSDDDDWSKLLWRLLNVCIEAGLEPPEVFAVALSSHVNKYARDNRPMKYLWRDVNKAFQKHTKLSSILGTYTPITMPEIITQEEVDSLQPTMIDEYREWGCGATDAIPSYHDLCCFMVLSAIAGGNLRLGTSYGTMVPNLWGLIIGDSTLTRKSTAITMAMEFIGDIDRELILATDGSSEGILTGLSERPNRVSVYYKDEITGLFAAFAKKDYLAGMPEVFTQLYDVPAFYTRRLRKEVITVTSPVFIFFGGGIRDKMYSLVNDEYILSGFLPRFLIVGGQTQLDRLRRTGPPTQVGVEAREKLLHRFADMYEKYIVTETIQIVGQEMTVETPVEAFLTAEAWERYGVIEGIMVDAASNSTVPGLALPSFERLSRSLLKMSVLLAASRQDPVDKTIQVELHDVLVAAKYIQEWGQYTIELLINAGRTTSEKALSKVLNAITEKPGVLRGEVMQRLHFTKREMTEIQDTLEDRGQIIVRKEGKAVIYRPIK